MKKGIRLVAFLLVFAVIYYLVDATVKLKAEDGIGTMKVYYSLPEDTVDVLMVGSSHIGMNVDPSILWEEYGIASFNLWSGMQPLWNSYYFLKEGLKTQVPKLVVVETFLDAANVDYSDYSAAVKSTIAMKWSLDKIRATYVSFEKWGTATEVLWGMAAYHERYAGLTEDDFESYFWNHDTSIQSIQYNDINAYPIVPIDFKAITQAEAISEKNDTYLRMIIDLCRVRGIPLLLVTSPFGATAEECMRYNRVQEIADETGTPYINYLKTYEEAGIDYGTDFRDIGHLNDAGGIQKLTNNLGEYIKTHYDVPDRRMDKSHIWNKQQDMQEQQMMYSLKEQFAGDGVSRFVDTGCKLFENIYGSWTLLAQIDANTVDDDRVYFSCFSEDPSQGNYGLLVKMKDNGALAVKLGGNIEFEIREFSETIRLAIIKNSTWYTLYVDGKLICSDQNLACPAYEGNLLIGCQELPGNEKFRFSRTTTRCLEVYDGVLSKMVIDAWNPEWPPESALPMGLDSDGNALIYRMNEQFVGDGLENYVDTNLQLYKDPASSFTLMTRLEIEDVEGDGVYFSCFSEDEADYRGLMARMNQNLELGISYGDNWGTAIACHEGESIDLAIRKQLGTYDIFVNGQKVVDNQTILCAPYAGTLLVGCQETAEGEKFRFSATRVACLEVYSGGLSDGDILGWTPAVTELPPKKAAEPVAYTLPSPFLGDGESRYIDTGVSLYDENDKDWTMMIECKPDNSTESKVFASCFSKEEGKYRGLLIRSEGSDSVTVLLGNQHAVTLPIDERAGRMRVVIVKQKYTYNVYLNGRMVGENIQSPCASYPGHLLLGCQEDAGGGKFRFSDVAIESLETIDRAMGMQEALQASALTKTMNRFE